MESIPLQADIRTQVPVSGSCNCCDDCSISCCFPRRQVKQCREHAPPDAPKITRKFKEIILGKNSKQ